MSIERDNTIETEKLLAKSLQSAMGLHECYAKDVARKMLLEIAVNYGSGELYISRSVIAQDRNQRIRMANDGTRQTREKICKDELISKATFYRVIS